MINNSNSDMTFIPLNPKLTSRLQQTGNKNFKKIMVQRCKRKRGPQRKLEESAEPNANKD